MNSNEIINALGHFYTNEMGQIRFTLQDTLPNWDKINRYFTLLITSVTQLRDDVQPDAPVLINREDLTKLIGALEPLRQKIDSQTLTIDDCTHPDTLYKTFMESSKVATVFRMVAEAAYKLYGTAAQQQNPFTQTPEYPALIQAQYTTLKEFFHQLATGPEVRKITEQLNVLGQRIEAIGENITAGQLRPADIQSILETTQQLKSSIERLAIEHAMTRRGERTPKELRRRKQ